MRKYDFRDFYQTFYVPTLDNSFFLLRKSEISKISITCMKARDVFTWYSTASVNIDFSEALEDQALNLDNLDDNVELVLKNPRGIQKVYKGFYTYLEKAMTKNLKLVDLNIHNTPEAKEVAIVQDLWKLIKENDTLERIYITITNHINCISILDACGFKPKIDTIIITCWDELSEEVKKHIMMFKRTHIFKSIQVYISLQKPKWRKSRCVVF